MFSKIHRCNSQTQSRLISFAETIAFRPGVAFCFHLMPCKGFDGSCSRCTQHCHWWIDCTFFSTLFGFPEVFTTKVTSINQHYLLQFLNSYWNTQMTEMAETSSFHFSSFEQSTSDFSKIISYWANEWWIKLRDWFLNCSAVSFFFAENHQLTSEKQI